MRLCGATRARRRLHERWLVVMGRGMLDEQTGFLCNVLVVSLQEGSAYHASNGMSALGGASV